MNIPIDNIDVIWDYRPDIDDFGLKRGDSFCYQLRHGKGSDGSILYKEYPYSPEVISYYHKLQNLARRELNQFQVSVGGKALSILELPDTIEPISRDAGAISESRCRTSVPYVLGESVSSEKAKRISQMLAKCTRLRVQGLQNVNIKDTGAHYVITDIAWDIPGFLLVNQPSNHPQLRKTITETYNIHSAPIYPSGLPT